MKVKRLKMRSFRAIADLTLEFDTDGPIVFIGVNGRGKTSILDCIRILLSSFVVEVIFFANSSTIYIRRKGIWNIGSGDIKLGSNETVNEIAVAIDGQQVKWSVTAVWRGERLETSSNLSELEQVANKIGNSWQESFAVSIPLVAYYPVNRSVMEIPLEIPKEEIGSRAVEAYDRAIDGIPVSFKSFFKWFRVREDLENEERRDDIDYRDKQLEAVRQAIYSLLEEEGFANLRVRRKPLRMTVSKQGEELSIDQLSDGEKCLLAMVGDWARRLAIANPSLENPLEGQGVLLIDEIELHLHPAWQRKIIPALTKTFPNCQLIVTTHSPQVVSHVKPEGIYILKTTPEGTVAERPAYSFGRDSNRILEDLMGVPARPLDIKERLRTLFEIIDEGNIAKAREWQQQLEKEIGLEEPEFAGAEALIRRKEILGR